MFLEGLPIQHALAMGDYMYLGRWARYSLFGTARYSCTECTVWGTRPFLRDCPSKLSCMNHLGHWPL